MSRKLYLMRHAEAAPGSPDRARPLTPAGRRQAQAMASLLRRMDIRPVAIWHSGRVRAAQSAQIVATALKDKPRVAEQAGLDPDSRVKPVVRAISRTRGDLLIVGHEPHLGKLATRLLAGQKLAALLDFPKAGVACLTCGRGDKWVLDWLIPPEIATAPESES